MARAPLTDEPSKVYVGMLIATCVAMLVGIIALAMEAGDYGWEQKPPTTRVPAPLPPPKVSTGGSALADSLPAPVAATPKTESPPVLPVLNLPLNPIVAEAPKPPESKPAEPKPGQASSTATPPGPTPSPLV